jgi:hypothetical protein
MMIRKEWLLAFSMAASTLMACAHGPEGYRPPTTRSDLLVVPMDEAERTRLPEWRLEVPLGEKQDDSVLAFLAWAEAAGARYVSDVDVVFAARQGMQVLECRTHLEPVLAYEQGARPEMRAVIDDQPRPGYSVQPCPQGACEQLLPTSQQPQALRYVLRPATDVPSRGFLARRWKLKKSAPECTPLEGGMAALADRNLRVEGHAWGCSDATASGCEDWAL